MAQLWLDKTTKALLEAAAIKHGQRLGVRNLSYNEFIKVLLGYWKETH